MLITCKKTNLTKFCKIGKVKRIHRHPDTNELESIEISDGILCSVVIFSCGVIICDVTETGTSF